MKNSTSYTKAHMGKAPFCIKEVYPTAKRSIFKAANA